MEDYIWKILHVPTGLFYCSRKGRFTDDITNLSKKGNFYTSDKMVEKVFNSSCDRAYINEAQTKKHKLDIVQTDSRARVEDFKIVKYSLKLIE